mmetsp:Transcript_12393/g.23227  ORF Transcript_12393/g.23227 Transcript_12393/m.23227 type:complete len:613 (+) Transcript_12393:162-2000(+)
MKSSSNCKHSYSYPERFLPFGYIILLLGSFCLAHVHAFMSKNAWVHRLQVTPVTSSSSKQPNSHEHVSNFHHKLNYWSSSRDKSHIIHMEYPTKNRYFATCIPGLSNVLAQELLSLGATNVEPSGTSGVYFSGNNDPSSSSDTTTTTNLDIGMKALLWLRTAHRIMQVISTNNQEEGEMEDSWNIMDRDSLYEFIQYTTPVQSLLGDGKGGLLTLSVSTILNGQVPKELCHSHYTSLTVKNALVDLVREARDDGMRPNVDIHDADVPLVLVLRGTYDRRGQLGGCEATLFRALHSGGSLHRRGYRTSAVHKAAMKESLAAGLLLEAGYDKLIAAAKEDGMPAVLVDPMAGSGTFCIEAALIASDFAPGLLRMKLFQSDYDENDDNGDRGSSSGGSGRNPHQVPPIVRWKGSDVGRWKQLVLEARDRAAAGMKWVRKGNKSQHAHDPRTRNCIIIGNEYNPNAASLARGDIETAGFSDCIHMNEQDCVDWDLSNADQSADNSVDSVIVPGRTIVVCNPPWGLRLTEDIEESWLSLKSFLRQQCNGAEAWILSGSKETTRFLRMKKSRSVVIQTGDEDLRWIQYHVFQKKASDNSDGQERREARSSSRMEDGFF